MRTFITTSLAATLILSSVSAQRMHQGFWGALGTGGGAVESEGLAYTVYERAGGTVDQRLLVGGEWYSFFYDLGGGAGVLSLSAVALVYPSRKGVFFAKAGLGYGTASSLCQVELVDRASGLAVTLGTGVDIRVGSNLYLTPGIDFRWQGGERRLCPAPDAPASGAVRGYSPGLFFSLGITWH